MESMDNDRFIKIPSITELPPGTQVASPEEVDKWNNIRLKNKVFAFIAVIICIITLGILFIPYIKWIYPDFEIDEWALRLLIVGMLAQPYLILKIITQYLFSK
jgi:hypothetical protein